jgi:hypothetical protein
MNCTSQISLRRIRAAAVLLTPLAALAARASADVLTTFTVPVRETNPVAGVGLVTAIDTVAVASGGSWMVEVDTDHADTSADQVVLLDGVLAARQGAALAAPAGTTISSFGSGGAPINIAGHWAWNYFLTGATTSTDSGIFFDNTLVIQEGALSTAPQFTPGTPYIGFFGAKLNNTNQILIMASIEDTAIASTVDRALVAATVSAGGALLSETVLAKEGDLLAGQTETVADFATGPHGWDWNDSGDVLFLADLNGSTASDGVLYLNGALLAQEGSASPVAGRTWASLSTSQRVALNGGGDWATTGLLSGTTTDDSVIVVNGAVFQQEGQPAPGVSGGWLLQGFGSGPVDLDDAGNVFWFGDWNDPDTARDTGIFRNDQLLVQEGVTVINGQLLTSIAGVQENFSVSADGRWLIFEGQIGADSAAIMIEMTGDLFAYCTAGTTTNGCVPAIASTGAPSVSFATPFAVNVANVEGQKAGLLFYGVSGPTALAWGTGSSFLCVKSPTQRTPSQSTGGTSAQCNGVLNLDWNAFLTANPGALGAPFQSGDVVWMQGWFRDPPASKTTNLSDALQFTLQP